MTDPTLTDLLHHAADPLDPLAAERILAGSVHGGDRRRRRRHLVVTAAAGGVAAAVTVGGLSAAGGGDNVRGEDPRIVATQPDPTTATEPADGATSYAPGSETELPGGPQIPTDRRLVGDDRLAGVVQGLLARDGAVTDLRVEHVSTAVVGHSADPTREGRRVDLLLDGMGTSITLQRWDGYAAVGIANPTARTESEVGQRVATTAVEACGGAYRVFPAVECSLVEGGAYHAGWPAQGAAMPDTHKELLVTLYTDDGWAIQVDSYNTAEEKAGGGPVRELPPLDEARSLEIAQSAAWFTAG